MAKFEVGQEVVVAADRALGGTQRHKISRVGRTNVYVQMRSREYAFDIESGRASGTTTTSTPSRTTNSGMRSIRSERD